jgi:hypothetical protein
MKKSSRTKIITKFQFISIGLLSFAFLYRGFYYLPESQFNIRRIAVSIAPALFDSLNNELQGRMIVYLSKKSQNYSEPRKAFNDEQTTVQAFGMDVNIKKRNQKIIFDKYVFGISVGS